MVLHYNYLFQKGDCKNNPQGHHKMGNRKELSVKITIAACIKSEYDLIVLISTYVQRLYLALRG